MNLKLKKLTAAAAALAVAVTSNIGAGLIADAAYGVGGNGTAVMEYLDRGVYAIKSGNGMFISWRFNANDDDNAEFQLFRDDQLIYTSKAGEATNYWDAQGNSGSKYRVDTLLNGSVVSSEDCRFTSGTNYFDIPLKSPGSIYSPNDCCAGDVNGDGQYEIIVKWDPSDSQDNSKTGKTSNVYIDCYTLTGQQLWRIDLGRNIRAGQHYTQLAVADFDCDGKAELVTKTCDGTVDGTGKAIGNASANYVDSSGLVLQGPEYMTLFEGATGRALDTIDFSVPRGVATGNQAKSTWGDDYGNRCERYNCAIAYLDGVHPSVIYGRGYYTRLTLSAVDVVNGKLSKKWVFDTGFNTSDPAYGCGNHNVMVADFDNDGRQEVCMGACCIDDNGKLLWSTRQGHGDAMHAGDLDPNREGIEVFLCHEGGDHGISLVDGKNGSIIWHFDGDKDTGRCCADNIIAGNSGAEFWGSRPAYNVYDVSGKQIGSKQPSTNFLIYWDGDLERELLDDIYITDAKGVDQYQTIFTASGCASNNGTKAVPCLTADLFGDWREELVLRTEDNSKLRVWCTNTETKYRITTLMHDMQYRMQCGCQQSSYNQPPHTSFYLGTEAQLPARPNVKLNNTPPEPVNGKLVKNLLVKDSANSGAWKLMESNKTGGAIYGDRDFTYTALPAELENCEYIMTACNSKNTDSDLAEFTAAEKAEVYVLVDTREEAAGLVPSWLSSYTRTDLTAKSSNDVDFAAYKKTVQAGEKVVLGTNGMSGNVINYTVFLKKPEIVTATTTTTSVTTTTMTTTTEPEVTITVNGGYNITEVLSYPSKTIYNEGENLDMSGVSVKARSVTYWESMSSANSGVIYGDPVVIENISLDPQSAVISGANGESRNGSQLPQVKEGTYKVTYNGQFNAEGKMLTFNNFNYEITVKKNDEEKADLMGDANCDGVVDLSDAILIMQALANPNKYGIGGTAEKPLTKKGQLNADVDTATKGLTGDDAVRIQEYLLKKIATLDPNG